MTHYQEDLKNTLLITHQDCPDGCGCAVVFRAAGGLKENVRFVRAGHGVGDFFKKNVDYINGFDRILLADVAPDEDAAERIEKEFSHVTCIDHHKTALFLQGKEWCNIDVSKCGTYLLFEHMFGKFDPNHEIAGGDSMKKAALYNFAVLTNDRDLWLREYRKSNEMSLLMDFLGQDRYVERALQDFFAFDWKDHEELLLQVLAEKKETYIEEKVKKTRLITKDNVKWGYVFISNHQSDVLNRVIEVYDVDVAVGIKLDGTGHVSLRSKETFDSSEFCSRMGGGGHAKAAAHVVDDKTLEEIIKTVHP